MAKKDCIILGAGLSGLACALTLKKKGFNPLIIEPENRVGGRVKSHRTSEGFILDHGFQVILDSYPEFAHFIDLKKLNLKSFHSGALIYNGQSLDLLGNPVAHPETLISSLFKDIITLKDKALTVKLIALSQLQRTDFPLGNKSTELFLREFGFSENFIELFWRPFLTGVFLDPELSLGENFFKFLIRCFSFGKVSIPENGMQELPLKMSEQLPADSILLNQSALSWDHDHVVLSNGEKIYAQSVVCTFNPEKNTDSLKNKDFAVTTHYLTSDYLQDLHWDKWLILIPQKLNMKINHLCVISSVAESYSHNRPLLSVSLVGEKKITLSELQKELNSLAHKDLKLEMIESISVPKALPRMTHDAVGFKKMDNVYYCGDRFASPSINGALQSGRLTAESIINQFK